MNQPRRASKKLEMLYTLSTESLSELRNILEERSVWVPHPDDCCNIGCTYEGELADVEWGFDCVLDALSAIEDAPWNPQQPGSIPPGLLAHIQEAASQSASDWLHKDTLKGLRRAHQQVLDAANAQHTDSCASDAVKERLMYVLCSEALLGIYTYMQENTSWNRDLHHYELMDVLGCLSTAKEMVDALYEKLRGADSAAVSGLLRDVASVVSDESLEYWREEAVSVIRAPFHALAAAVATQAC